MKKVLFFALVLGMLFLATTRAGEHECELTQAQEEIGELKALEAEMWEGRK
jgi:hypothetical protein